MKRRLPFSVEQENGRHGSNVASGLNPWFGFLGRMVPTVLQGRIVQAALLAIAATALVAPSAVAMGAGLTTVVDDPFCLIDINASATSAPNEALDCDALAVTVGVAAPLAGDIFPEEGGSEIHCGFQQASGTNWDNTGCDDSFSSDVRVRYSFLVYCTASCDANWKTNGKIFSYFSVNDDKFTTFYASYSGGVNQGTHQDVNCNEYKKKTSTADLWSGGIGQGSGCLGLTYPKGGWDAGIKLK